MTKQPFRASLLALAILTSPALDAEPRQHTRGSGLTILLDNYAGVEGETLAAAAEVARRIYQRAGVETRWIDCGSRPDRPIYHAKCEAAPGPGLIHVRIMPAVREGFEAVGGFVYGFALPSTSGGFGWAATVFQDRVLGTVRTSHVSEANLLGCVIAHETGHLLLGKNSHSSYGLMSADWTRAELQKMAEGALGFVSSERRKIQRSVEARLAARATPIGPN